MSSILKALQKLEQEKRARRSGNQDIAAGVLRNGRRPPPRPAWIFPATLAITTLIAVLVTYLVVRPAPETVTTVKSSPPTADLPHQPPGLPPGTTAAPEAPANYLIIPGNTAPEGYLSATPPRSTPLPAAPATELPQHSLPPPVSVAEPAPAEPPAPVEKHPRLSVTGIGWQKDSSSRLAVVNGTAVSEGSSIEGARVEEIFPDRVRFSAAGERFEVFIGKANH